MPNATHSPIVLTPAQIEFALGNVVIYAGSVSDSNHANLTHAYGCAIDADGAVLVYIDPAHAQALIADVRRSGNIAVSFAQPGTEQALQLKAVNAEVIAANDNAGALIARYYDRIVDHIRPFGFSEPMLRTFFAPPANVVAVRFKPHVAFDQTPGPNAGAKIEVKTC